MENLDKALLELKEAIENAMAKYNEVRVARDQLRVAEHEEPVSGDPHVDYKDGQ